MATATVMRSQPTRPQQPTWTPPLWGSAQARPRSKTASPKTHVCRTRTVRRRPGQQRGIRC
eukprot:scaffold15343_cov52-Phaeocystis_antarctica.AAC.1